MSKEILSNVQRFVSEFSNNVEGKHADKGVRVAVLGSYSRGEWRPGSDLDVVVYADRRLSMREKAEIYRTFVSLAEKHGIMRVLENAPCLHPPILFVDDPIRRALSVLILRSKRLRLRRAMKRIMPAFKHFRWLVPL